ncbi:MAG: DUF3800 domain-containing protein [Planctomycetes bacterium]|nr:DUF3800 domain-containing protein [Planctomycetota bacterium]
MRIFIDESGDCGMKRQNSADYFAVAAILVPTEAIVACETAIQETRTLLKLPSDFEFHFGRIKDRHRREFLARMAKCEFTYVACYINKLGLHGEHWRDKSFFYESVLGALADSSAGFLLAAQESRGAPLNAKLIADDNNDAEYMKILRRRFRNLKADGKSLVEKVGAGRSRSLDMIQLADMVCGAVVRWHEKQEEYLDLIRKREGKVVTLFEEKKGGS